VHAHVSVNLMQEVSRAQLAEECGDDAEVVITPTDGDTLLPISVLFMLLRNHRYDANDGKNDRSARRTHQTSSGGSLRSYCAITHHQYERQIVQKYSIGYSPCEAGFAQSTGSVQKRNQQIT
jgi:hypothetical protein